MLKNAFKILFKSVFVAISLLLIFIAFYLYNNELYLFEAKFIWPSSKFTVEHFKQGSTLERASMAADLISSKNFIGLRCESIPIALGPRTGDYYVSDSNHTYKLTEKSSANWILTFVCSDKGIVEQVIIRKSCCSMTRKLINWGLDL